MVLVRQQGRESSKEAYMFCSENTTRMPRRVSNMMANAIVGSAQARRKREAVGREGKPFVKPGQVLVEKKSVGGRQPWPQ